MANSLACESLFSDKSAAPPPQPEWYLREVQRVGLVLPTGSFWGSSPAGGAVDPGTRPGRLEGWKPNWPPSPPVISCYVPKPRGARLPSAQQGLHDLTAFPANSVLLPPLDEEEEEEKELLCPCCRQGD